MGIHNNIDELLERRISLVNYITNFNSFHGSYEIGENVNS